MKIIRRQGAIRACDGPVLKTVPENGAAVENHVILFQGYFRKFIFPMNRLLTLVKLCFDHGKDQITLDWPGV